VYYYVILLSSLLFFVKNVMLQCPISPQVAGKTGPTVMVESMCAISCRNSLDCIQYLFKDQQDFLNSGTNSFETNCVLQTAFDYNFMAEEVIDATGYIGKVYISYIAI
jgi:hypothetical protein